MKKQALKINNWQKNVYVKVPIINSKGKFMGKLIKELNNEKYKIKHNSGIQRKQTKKILKN